MSLSFILNQYRDYLEEDFPESKFTKEFNNPNINRAIKNIFKSLELIRLYMDHEKIPLEVKKILKVCHDDLLKYIYILPFGEQYFYNSIVRKISETLLRLYILMFDNSKKYSDIESLSYRSIKEILNDCEKSKLNEYKPNIDFFKGQYGLGSKVIHGTIEINNIKYLHSIQRDNICDDPEKIQKFTKNIEVIFNNKIKDIYDLNKKDYSTSQLSILEDTNKY